MLMKVPVNVNHDIQKKLNDEKERVINAIHKNAIVESNSTQPFHELETVSYFEKMHQTTATQRLSLTY
jgi:hypothetical protein